MLITSRLTSPIIFLIGLAVIAQTFMPHSPKVLEPLLEIVPHPTRMLEFLLGVGLIYLSYQLYSLRQVAWRLSVIGVMVTVAFALFSHHFIVVALGILGLSILYKSRQLFVVRSNYTSVIQGVTTASGVLVIALLYGTIGFYVLDTRAFGISFSLTQSLIATLREYTLLGNPTLIPRTPIADWFLDSVDLMGLLGGLLMLVSLFRPARSVLIDQPHARREAAFILNKWGRSSDDFFKLWPHDKLYWFSQDKQVFIAYRVYHGNAIALGDPTGPQECINTALKEFIAWCAHQGWRACFLYTLPEMTDAYQALGLDVFKIGEDAVISVSQFHNSTRHKKYFRSISKRFYRRGYTVQYFKPPHSQRLMRDIKSVSEAWLQVPGRTERGFALGHFSQDYLKSAPLMCALDPEGKTVAFVNEIESYVPGRSSIDLMRYNPAAPNGVMDFLLAEYLSLLNERGVKEFNLGFVPLSNSLVNSEPTVETQALKILASGGKRLFSSQGLYNFKSKFNPIWEPRYLAYQGSPLHLVSVAMAIYRALR